MSLSSRTSVNCAACGYSEELEVFGSINTSTDPELKEKVSSGELFLWHCPRCGHTGLLRYQTLYHDPSERVMVWLTLGDSAAEGRAKALFGASGELSDYTGRIVDDVGSLVEKVNIFDAGLDDVAIELCKFVIRSERGSDLNLKFLRLDGAESELVFSYPGEGRMEMLAVGLGTYEDCCAILERNPAVRRLADGLARVDSDLISELTR